MKTYHSLLSIAIATSFIASPALVGAQTYTAYDLGFGYANGIDGNNVVGQSPGGAAWWTGTSSASINLLSGSAAMGVSGSTVVGSDDANTQNAKVWNSNSFENSGTNLGLGRALGVSGNMIVGEKFTADQGQDAAVWTAESASSGLDIAPTGFALSYAVATNGQMIVGNATENGVSDAFAWTGTSATDAVDINPAGYVNTFATGVSGNNIVGYVDNQTMSQALLWTGASSADVSTLNSSGYLSTRATGIAGNYIVGWGQPSPSELNHALLWTGPNFSTRIDLNQFLAPGYTDVYASGVDAAGDICGYGAGPNGFDALLWKINPAPEPSMLILPALGLLGILKRKLKD